MSQSRKFITGALAAAACLIGLTVPADAGDRGRAGRHGDQRADVGRHRGPAYGGRQPFDDPKLDRTLNERAAQGGENRSRAIVMLEAGCSVDGDVAKLGGRSGRKFGVINGQLVELPNSALRRFAGNPCVASMHYDRRTGGEMNRAAIVEGARAVQAAYGVDGAGVGVAVVDSGITGWHDDLTYLGRNSAVKVVNGQRVVKFVDFVNGRTTPYDDNGHGTHVSGIIAGNGYDTLGARAGMAPAADIISLKVLDAQAGGYISNVIAALDWIVNNRSAYNIRVVNLSVGAAVTESYRTDPLTLAAKRVVDAGVVVVTAAGNLGRNPVTGTAQYGAITSPGNAPWVLTVGAYSHEGTLTRTDDKYAEFSSRGPTATDFLAKPDVLATGVGIVSLSVPGSLMYSTKSSYLLSGVFSTVTKPYLSLSGTSMAAPVVAGAVALMMQVNPKLTPNLAKAIIEYTAQDYHYDSLTQGAGFLNAKGAVDLARFLYAPAVGQLYPHNDAWSRTILWGNRKLNRGVIKPQGSAWSLTTAWGASTTAEGDNIVWGTACGAGECDNIVWGTSQMDADNIVWGTFAAEGDNIVWGTMSGELDNIVWGTACAGECDNIVWGTECGGADCDNIVWGTNVASGELDNIVWGTAMEADNIVWGTSGELDNIVWGTSSDPDDVTWGCSGTDTPVFDDPSSPSAFDGTIDIDGVFGTQGGDAPVSGSSPTDPLVAEATTTTTTTTSLIGEVL